MTSVLQAMRNMAMVGMISVATTLALTACAGKPDHFYTLRALPDRGQESRISPTKHVLLNVTVPSMVDRSEMVINSSPHGVMILDHQRWAAPLADQVAATLARDIEGRRNDVLVGDRSFDQAGNAPTTIKVDIVQMTVHKGGGGGAVIEVHWHIIDGRDKQDSIGGDRYEAPLSGGDYAAIARAYSETLSALADRLVGEL
jgi:uncharacterized lipoprotein YmbA